jgi:Aspartyl protease
MRALACILGLMACSATLHQPPADPPPPKSSPASFDYVGQSWMRFDATVSDRILTRLILDTGGGVTVLSRRLCERALCVPDGTFSGKRMSGQEIRLAMVRVPAILFAGLRLTNVRVAVLDLDSLLHPELGVEGFVAMDLFREQAFTIDYRSRSLVLEDEKSLERRSATGVPVEVRVMLDGPSTELYLPIQLLPNLPPLLMEVDSGSRDLILDERFMAPLGIAPSGPGVKRFEGRDETAQPYFGYFATLPGVAEVVGANRVTVPQGSTVMFQKIIHDGLVGHTFLSAHTTTFDVPHRKMIFGD